MNTPPATPPDIHFVVSPKDNQKQFQIGELITIEGSVSSTTTDKYFARGPFLGLGWRGTLNVSPAKGWTDVSRIDSVGGICSGCGGGIGFPAKEVPIHDPVAVGTVRVNDHIRFDQPGDYTLEFFTIVYTHEGAAKSTPVDLLTTLTIHIVAADPAWQQSVFEKGKAAYDTYKEAQKHKVNWPDKPMPFPQEEVAQLCTVGTLQAALYMADTLDMTQFRKCLVTTPDRAAVRLEVNRLFREPQVGVDRGFLDTFTLLLSNGSGNLPESSPGMPQTRREILEHLSDLLPSKVGDAQIVSLSTVLSEPPPSPPTTGISRIGEQRFPPPVVAMFAEHFTDLPMGQQAPYLQHQWPLIESPAMLPALQKFFTMVTEKRGANFFYGFAENDAGLALVRWYQMDPESARPVILKEIVRPDPHFTVRILGMLPDKSLPDQEEELAHNFLLGTGSAAHIAGLLNRYATRRVFAIVEPTMEARLETASCEEAGASLAYLNRVDPAGATARTQKALASELEKNRMCDFFNVTPPPEPPLDLLAAATKILRGPDWALNREAAAYVSEHGPPEDERLLENRLLHWEANWNSDPKSKVRNPALAKIGISQDYTGSALLRALLQGRQWLILPAKLAELKAEISEPELLDMISRCRQNFYGEEAPYRVEISHNWNKWIPQYNGYFYQTVLDPETYGVAQYSDLKMPELKAKLGQFPPTTIFHFSANDFTLSDVPAMREICKFLKAHHYVIDADPGSPYLHD